jgi:ABC-type polysaccharide/polyol phosphate transport system ATPase subunit
MISTENSESLLSVKNIRVHFELEHYQHYGLRDVFISALSHPVDYFFKTPELLYVIDDLSFELKRGMRLGIVGTNGSGKTTLCRCIAGMMRPQQGRITSQLEVRAIFDTGTGIMPDLTGRENAYLLARLFFPQEKDLKPLVEEAIEFSELGHFIDIPFRQYSKGMQSRIMLSLISSKPTDILILDEVFDGADVFFQKKLSVRMKRFIENAGATIFVSHSADQIRQVCNTLMVLRNGKISFLGAVEEGLDHYMKQSPGPSF